MQTLEMTCGMITDYYIDRIHALCELGKFEDAESMNMELMEWLHNRGEQEVFSLPYKE